MKFSKIIMLGLGLCSAGMLSALDDVKAVKSWVRQFSSNGKLEIAWDSNADAMRFTSTFNSNGKDHWLYPGIKLSSADRKADFLEFEIRMEANPERRGVKNCLVMFANTGWKNVGQIYYATPGKEFKKIRLDLRKLKFKLDNVWLIRIGLNFNDAAEGAIWLRNVRFVKASPAK